MTPSRKKLITNSVLLLGVGVVVMAGITLYPSVRERYWIWKLESESEEQRLEAAKRLGDVGSVRAISALIEAAAVELSHPEIKWGIGLPGYSLSRRSSYEAFIYLPRNAREASDLRRRWHPWRTFVGSIREIMRNNRQSAEAFLRRSLSDEREVVRAVAASLLFEGTDRVREYVSPDRLFTWPQPGFTR